MSEPSPLYTDTFALCEWLLNHLDREPGVLAQTLCQTALTLLETIAFALKNRLRDERLDEADERLLALRLQLRLAGSTGLLTESQVLFALESANRIGRQIGGWQRVMDSAY